MKYEVSQIFASLGDPSTKTFDSWVAAQHYANELKADITDMISGWENAPASQVGFSNEFEAWDEAYEMSDGGVFFSGAAAQMIAKKAIKIEKFND